MAQYGFDDLVVTIDDSGGDARAITAYVTEVSGFEIEAILEDGHTAGDSWVERVYTGLYSANEFTLTGFYDDTASVGPNALMAIGDQRTFLFTWDGVGASKTSAFECFIKKWDTSPAKGELTKFTATLQPTGAVSEDGA